MRVAVRPAYAPGRSGGVEQYAQGLASGLSALETDDRFDFVGTHAQRASLSPHISGAATWVDLPQGAPDLVARLRDGVAGSPFGGIASSLRERWRHHSPAVDLPRVPSSVDDGPYDVVHFAAQAAERSRHPTIYQPWDLQHRHYPDYFSPGALARRDVVWRLGCVQASYVLVASEFVRADVVDAFSIDPARVAVVAPGVPAQVLAAASAPERPFALFPAQTWEHKNHARLIDAIALLRSRGLDVPVLCPGQPNPRGGAVHRHARDRHVDDLVRFPGHVSIEQLGSLYGTARCVVFPSLFEGFGFPVLEAFRAGVPVACSNTTSLPELAGDAAVLFDPTDVEAIADGIEQVWTDDDLRSTLVARGSERSERYSWDGLARSCRALYRAAAEVDLQPGDNALLRSAGVIA
jgi:glycosyltransferase involved in cell wall biosynthesis